MSEGATRCLDVLLGYSALGLACLGAAVAFFTSLLSFFSAELMGLLVGFRWLVGFLVGVLEPDTCATTI
ncbi:MAG: hypothetical protein QOE04_2045, partial [Mycobacterium sp.]|nr:hypothetical protein [Mycobacterium sp.]